jgi:hypothetical protein
MIRFLCTVVLSLFAIVSVQGPKPAPKLAAKPAPKPAEQKQPAKGNPPKATPETKLQPADGGAQKETSEAPLSKVKLRPLGPKSQPMELTAFLRIWRMLLLCPSLSIP